jgi:hypothetical protein
MIPVMARTRKERCVTIFAGVDAGAKMFVPFAGSLAAAEATDRKARTISFPATTKFEDFICCINVLFPRFSISQVVFCSGDSRCSCRYLIAVPRRNVRG